MTPLAALIWDTFRECRDKKLFWIMLLISTVVAAGVACIRFTPDGMEFFFGAVSVAYPGPVARNIDAAALTAAFLSYVVVSLYIGWVGTVIGLTATAGIFPSFTQSGAIDVVLSKPLSRWTVFLGKYAGALSFILVQAAYFVLVTLVVIRLHTGQWIWGYLWAIPLLVALFSYLYCISALAGLWTRSGVGALMVTMIFWAVVWGVAQADTVFTLHGHMGADQPPAASTAQPPPGTAATIIHRVNAILPRTQDIPVLVAQRMGALSLKDFASAFAGGGDGGPHISPDAALDAIAKPTIARSVGGSLVFELVVLLIAGTIFARRDY